MNTREEELRTAATTEIVKHTDKVQSDPYRLSFHHMPPVGLLNDPNGLVHWKGEYHVFYQWMPFKTGHGEKFWGHYISDDLVNWKHERIALTPSEWYDKDGCYSGSAIIHNDQLYLFYTGNVFNEEGEQEEYQCLAVSEDGVNFEKKGPVIYVPEGFTSNFRDPKVWKGEEHWYLVVGAQNRYKQGKVLLYRSSNLHKWELLGAVAGSNENRLGDFGYMWECPDLFNLDGQDILVVSPQGLQPDGMKYNNTYQSGYFAGRLRSEEASFEHGEFQELDRGFEFYAPQTFFDGKGRRIMYGWMGVPDQNEPSHPTVANQWIHALTIPRILSWDGSRLLQQPVPELETMREAVLLHSEIMITNDQKAVRGVEGRPVELRIEFEAIEEQFALEIFHYASLSYKKSDGILTLSRPQLDDKSKTEFRRTKLKEELKELRIFIDHSSLEIFVNRGSEVFTSRIFPQPEDDDILFTSLGSSVFSVEQWKLSGYHTQF
ncbi:sucrose-6-phosphate hydrolase [Halobacillus sp. Marseille-P3879]|uniref:glycoside hydrolase family 32 protein n=1 Tax=Halobacillus sp. Marseille-P3879 TaxID=2045014 RepID=UPI000C7AFE76|nr:sucrose-6-phosphate hydrolase [Halobacillus sp. Marseille-P3879]